MERQGLKRPQSTRKRTKGRQQCKDIANYARQKLLERRNNPQEEREDIGLAPNILLPPLEEGFPAGKAAGEETREALLLLQGPAKLLSEQDAVSGG